MALSSRAAHLYGALVIMQTGTVFIGLSSHEVSRMQQTFRGKKGVPDMKCVF